MKNRPPEGINTVTSLGLGTTPRVATWLLRSLIQTESYSDRFHGYRFGQLVKRLGLMKEQFDDEKKPEVFLEALLRQLEALERRVGEGDAEDPVFRNVDRIAAMLNLTETERDLLAFGVLTHFDTEFQECFDELRGPTFGAIAEMLAGIVGHSSKEIRAALRADSMLSQAGLMSARPFAERQSSNPLEVPAEIAGALVLEHRDEESLLRCLFQPAPAPRLDQVDFSYLEADIDILGGFLSAAVAQHKPGVNVLMHGAPGLGKTELARTLVAGLDVALFEVNITAIDGEPIRPASRITAYRTAATSANASKYLARSDSRTLGLIGAGRQAYMHIQSHATIFALETIKVYDVRPEAVEALIRHLPHFKLKAASAEEAVACDIVCTLTPAKAPVVKASWVRPGTHINAVGADAAGKQELDPGILMRAQVVVDDLGQACHGGEINVALSQGLFTKEQVWSTIGEILAGTKPGRQDAQAITVFDSTGLAIEDIATARLVYHKAKERGGYLSMDIVA